LNHTLGQGNRTSLVPELTGAIITAV